MTLHTHAGPSQKADTLYIRTVDSNEAAAPKPDATPSPSRNWAWAAHGHYDWMDLHGSYAGFDAGNGNDSPSRLGARAAPRHRRGREHPTTTGLSV